jgi:hypothetical protein
MIYGAEYSTWVSEPETCGSCGAEVPELFPCTWDTDLMVGQCCVEPCTEESTGCLALDAVIMQASNLDEICSAVKAHEAECARCGSTAATVQTDRLYLNPFAVCCEAA